MAARTKLTIMRVNANGGPSNVTGIPSRSPVQSPGLGQDKLVASGADALNTALEQTPAARADSIARARGLVADASYPSAEVVRKIAGLMADKINGHLNENL